MPAENLAEVIRLRVRSRRAGVAAIARARDGVVLRLPDPDTIAERMRTFVARSRGRLQWTPEGLRLRTDGEDFAGTVRLIAEVLDQLTAARGSQGGAQAPGERAAAAAGSGRAGGKERPR